MRISRILSIACALVATGASAYSPSQNGGAFSVPGAPGGYGGTVYGLAPDGSGYSILHSFQGAIDALPYLADGWSPDGALFQNPIDHLLYGTTINGGIPSPPPV